MSVESKFCSSLSWQHRIMIGVDFIDQILKNHEISLMEKHILIIVINEIEFRDACLYPGIERSVFDKYFTCDPKELDKALINLKNKKLLSYCGRAREASGLVLPYEGFRL